MKHFTMTGVYAGTTFCLSYYSEMGKGTSGERKPDDQYAHYAYASDSYRDADDVCADCKHVSKCEDNSPCERCRKLGYSDR